MSRAQLTLEKILHSNSQDCRSRSKCNSCVVLYEKNLFKDDSQQKSEMNVAISRKNIIWLLMDIDSAKKNLLNDGSQEMNVAAIAKDALVLLP